MKKFPAKVLLLGEYTTLQDGSALAVPMHRFHATLRMYADEEMHLHPEVEAFMEYLLARKEEFEFLKLHRIAEDLSHHLSLQCDIPIGYGLGSSGAITASIYARYAAQKESKIDRLAEELALMESYFHGSSSGLDPLVSYMDRAILKTSDSRYHLLPEEEAESVMTQHSGQGRMEWFLIDTGKSRRTAPLVNRYEEMSKEEQFRASYVVQVHGLVEESIELLRNGKSALAEIREIGCLQFHYLKAMIPEELQSFWSETISEKETGIKLCGAGGGGVFLAYSSNRKRLVERSPYPVISFRSE